MKLSAIFFPLQNGLNEICWILSSIKLISYSEFACATDDFQKARKNVIFENCIKNLSFEKDQMFDVF